MGISKGHVENNETEVETANRELFEETNLLVEYIPGFRAVTNYVMVEYGNKKKTGNLLCRKTFKK